jgi:hypothetical protein
MGCLDVIEKTETELTTVVMQGTKLNGKLFLVHPPSIPQGALVAVGSFCWTNSTKSYCSQEPTSTTHFKHILGGCVK